MGEKDVAEKTLKSYNDEFADIMNALLFDGKQLVQESDLIDAQTFSQYKADNALHLQERDVAKYWKHGKVCMTLIGLENQTAPDKSMPLRVASYGGANYGAQAPRPSADWCPVITVVLYFGTKTRWNTAMALSDCFAIPDALLPFFSDHRLNVIEVGWLSDEQIARLRGDFRHLAEYLRARRLGTPYTGSEQKIRHLIATLELLRVVSGDDSFKQIEPLLVQQEKAQGGTNMCEVVQSIKREGIAIGEKRGIAIGEERGAQQNRIATAKIGFSMGLELAQIAQLTGLGRDELLALKETL